MDEYSYYEKDGAYFRRRNGTGVVGVQDVLSKDHQWVPYKGEDALAPVIFGSRVTDPLQEGTP